MTQMQIMDRKLELITAYLLAKDAGSRKQAEQTLKEFLENLPFQGETRRARTRNEAIRDVLVELGAGEHLDGYEYLVEAIEAKLDGKRRHIYAGVARKHEITESRVERACRGVVSWVFRVGEPEKLYRFFGGTVPQESGRPTNYAFIARIANEVKRRTEEV